MTDGEMSDDAKREAEMETAETGDTTGGEVGEAPADDTQADGAPADEAGLAMVFTGQRHFRH